MWSEPRSLIRDRSFGEFETFVSFLMENFNKVALILYSTFQFKTLHYTRKAAFLKYKYRFYDVFSSKTIIIFITKCMNF